MPRFGVTHWRIALCCNPHIANQRRLNARRRIRNSGASEVNHALVLDRVDGGVP